MAKKTAAKKKKEITQSPVKVVIPVTPSVQSEAVSSSNVYDAFVEAYGKGGGKEETEKFQEIFKKYIKQEVDRFECAKDYNILILFDNTTLLKSDADLIYKAITAFGEEKPILFILLSNGGESSSAYLIGKLCQEFKKSKFLVVIPRYAKSAATLLACAADQIHMGSMSELGPIDPQINSMPALGLKNSIEHIAELVDKTPGSAEMFAKYLHLSIKPIQIGYYERVAESSVQYAEKLLNNKTSVLKGAPADIAHKLVYGYKDHGFIIDKAEAVDIFGKQVIKSDTAEYQLGNAIYSFLSSMRGWADIWDYNFYLIGSINTNPGFFKKPK